jgi:uncharacterized protein YjiS (DUF1127 family)
MTTSTVFASTSHGSGTAGRLDRTDQSFGKILFTMMAAVRRFARHLDERRQLATLDGRALDDIGITQAERDALLQR